MVKNLLTKKEFRQLVCEVEDFMSEFCNKEATIDDFLLGYSESEYRTTEEIKGKWRYMYSKTELLKDILSAQSDDLDQAAPAIFNKLLHIFMAL